MITNPSQLLTEAEVSQLREVYLISNTAAFFYKKLVVSEAVNRLLRINTPQVIAEFERIATAGVTTPTEMTLLYALYCVLLNKPDELAESYVRQRGQLQVEWFGDFYSLRYSTPQTITQTWAVTPEQHPANTTKGWKQRSETMNSSSETSTLIISHPFSHA